MATIGDGSQRASDEAHDTKEPWIMIQNLERKCDKRFEKMSQDFSPALQQFGQQLTGLQPNPRREGKETVPTEPMKATSSNP